MIQIIGFLCPLWIVHPLLLKCMTVCFMDSYLQTFKSKQQRTEAEEITFSVQCVQQQPNTNDCGAFSIAFLAELLFDGSPTEVQFDVGDMRGYLHLCLLNSKFECPFLKIEGAQQHSLPYDTVITVPVHCACRMPHFKSDDKEEALQKAECDCCHCWYHRSCVSVPDRVFKKRDQLWFCLKCF